MRSVYLNFGKIRPDNEAAILTYFLLVVRSHAALKPDALLTQRGMTAGNAEMCPHRRSCGHRGRRGIGAVLSDDALGFLEIGGRGASRRKNDVQLDVPS